MKGFKGKFVKKNGDQRSMTFVKLSDLPKEILMEQVSGTGQKRQLQENMELVFDVEKQGLRVFNWETATYTEEVFLDESKILRYNKKK